jgi:hypothetical protein
MPIKNFFTIKDTDDILKTHTWVEFSYWPGVNVKNYLCQVCGCKVMRRLRTEKGYKVVLNFCSNEEVLSCDEEIIREIIE